MPNVMPEPTAQAPSAQRPIPDAGDWPEVDEHGHCVLDNQGHLLRSNAAFDALTDNHLMIINPAGRIGMTDRKNGQLLRKMIAEVAISGQRQHHVFHLYAGCWLAVSVAVLRTQSPALTMHTQLIDLNEPIDLDRVAGLFGISASERPVFDGLVNAVCPKQISRTIGLSVHTIRSHIRSIYLKMSVNTASEAQLRALILALSLKHL